MNLILKNKDKKKRFYKYLFGFKTKREALKEGNKFEVYKAQNRISTKNPSFADYFINWAKTYKMPGKTPGSQERYKILHRRIEKHLGATKIDKIKRIDYQKFINELGAKFAKDTMQKTHGTIRSCVKDAIEDGVVHVNFTSRINLVYNKDKTRKIEYLSVKDTQKLVKQAISQLDCRYTSKYMILTAIYSGARIGEIMALTWDDIDFDSNLIKINKSYDYVNNRIKETKIPSSVRQIKVPDSLMAWIQELKQNKEKYIFASPYTHKVPTSTAVNKALRTLLKKCEIEKQNFHFHSLRHTHVAYLLYNHIDLQYISKRLGHSSMVVTARVYAYLIDEMRAYYDTATSNALNKLAI